MFDVEGKTFITDVRNTITVRAASCEAERLVGHETKTGIFMTEESLISCPPQGGLVKRLHGYERFTGQRAKARSNCLTMSAKLIPGSRRIPEIATGLNPMFLSIRLQTRPVLGLANSF
jgi:hypothetical protein